MLHTLISKHRRVRWNDDGTKKIVTREQAGKDWSNPDICRQWEPTYLKGDIENPNGGIYNRSSMVTAIANASNISRFRISAILSGAPVSKTFASFSTILSAIEATEEERAPVLKRFCQEYNNTKIEADQLSPETLFASPAFATMDYSAAMSSLVDCFLYDHKEKKLITLQDFFATSPDLLHDKAPRFIPLTNEEAGKLAKRPKGAVGNASNHINNDSTPSPFDQLPIFHALGLDSAQAATMLQKYWNPKQSNLGSGGAQTPTMQSLEQIFTAPSVEDPEHFKTKGELLHDLRRTHCVVRENGEEQTMLWREAGAKFLSVLQKEGLAAFAGDSSAPSFEAITLERVATALGRSTERARQMETGHLKDSNAYVDEKHIAPIIKLFNLPAPLAQAFREAPDLPATQLIIDGKTWRVDDYHDHLKEKLTTEPSEHITADEPALLVTGREKGIRIKPRDTFATWEERATIAGLNPRNIKDHHATSLLADHRHPQQR